MPPYEYAVLRACKYVLTWLDLFWLDLTFLNCSVLIGPVPTSHVLTCPYHFRLYLFWLDLTWLDLSWLDLSTSWNWKLAFKPFKHSLFRVAQNTKKIENYIFPHCIRYTILFQELCKKNQIHSFKIGASQATLIFQPIREKIAFVDNRNYFV